VVRHLKVNSRLRGSNVPPQTVDEEADFFTTVMKRVTALMGLLHSSVSKKAEEQINNSY